MKKIFCILLALTLIAACLCGCGTEHNELAAGEKLRVTATIFPPYDFTRQIAGDLIDLTMLLSPETESHGFEPTLSDLAQIQSSDVFIYIGGESEKWVDSALASIDTSSVTVIRLLDCIEGRAEETVEGMESDDDEDEDGGIDEHIWTSPRNAIVMSQTICSALCSRDSAHEDEYQLGLDAFTEQLAELDSQLSELSANSARHTLVFAERFPFLYLAKDYGFDYYAAFPGCSSDTEPSLATISFLCGKIEEENIPAVFYIEFSTQTVADTICEATGAKKLLLHSCHNLTQEDFDAGVTYVVLMRQNIENLKEALH